MPAHNGVDSKLKPCNGSQIPCSQMMSMNCNPPRPTEAISPARLPAQNARMRNRLRWNIGSATLVSMMQKAASRPMPPNTPASTHGLPHPVAESP